LQTELSAALPQFACFWVGFKRTKAKGMGRLDGSSHDAVRFYHLRGALREDGPGGSSPLSINSNQPGSAESTFWQ
jgi:hypothetical protein